VVLPKHHVAVTSGVIDYNFRGTNFGDGFLEGSGQAGWVGHVCGLSVYGCGWGGGGVERGKRWISASALLCLACTISSSILP